MRRAFAAGLLSGVRIVWPIISVLLLAIVALGVVAGIREGWSLGESIYFAFVSALTIGYGDLAPKTFLGRVFAIAIGLSGVLLTSLIAAIVVRAFAVIRGDDNE
jgi:hypothetical protein